ncbi:MAG TPA: hypothetical protein VFJ82_13425 [Longimicrobium sp.]|nr:hypothetical protein [Longimicrobium sp.]
MHKLKLDPEHLSVESFATRTPEAEQGTVYGHVTKPGFDCMPTGIQYPTCNTCPNPTIEEPGCA